MEADRLASRNENIAKLQEAMKLLDRVNIELRVQSTSEEVLLSILIDRIKVDIGCHADMLTVADLLDVLTKEAKPK